MMNRLKLIDFYVTFKRVDNIVAFFSTVTFRGPAFESSNCNGTATDITLLVDLPTMLRTYIFTSLINNSNADGKRNYECTKS